MEHTFTPTKDNLCRCIDVFRYFYLEADRELEDYEYFNIPSNMLMCDTLMIFGLNMVSFVEFVDAFFGSGVKLWEDSATEFFRNHEVVFKWLDYVEEVILKL